MSGAAVQRTGYLRQLDGLRALAVGAVFVEHWLPKQWMLHRLLPWGAGVKLFFVLSGFLITGILLDCRRGAAEGGGEAAHGGGEAAAAEQEAAAAGTASLRPVLAIARRFWARRFLRIFPAFYAVAITAALCGVASARATLPFNLTYSTNFHLAAAGAWHGEVSHFWSLAVEEQFYLVWPWVILVLPLPAIRRLLALLLIAAPAFRWWAAASGLNPVAASVLPPACFDTLGAGALLALARRGLGPAWFSRLLRPPFPALAVAAAAGLTALHLGGAAGMAGGAGTMGVPAVVGVPAITAGEVLAGPRVAGPSDLVYAAGLDLALALAFVALVARAAEGFEGRAGALLGARPLVYLGTISYGLYLLHNFVPGLIGWAPLYPWMRPLVYPFVTAALAAASWRFFEEPINRAKRFFPYERPRHTAGHPSHPAGRPPHGRPSHPSGRPSHPCSPTPPPRLQPHLAREAGP